MCFFYCSYVKGKKYEKNAKYARQKIQSMSMYGRFLAKKGEIQYTVSKKRSVIYIV